MRLVFALAASTLFGTGAYLLLSRDLVRVVLGIVIVSQAATLTIIASGRTRGDAPILPLPGGEEISDPLSQAMALTAIVIGLAVTALLLVLVLRVVETFHSREVDEVAEEEVEHDALIELEHSRPHEAEEEAAR